MLVALTLALFTACSGSGSSGSGKTTPPTTGTLLIVDGNAGLDGLLTGRLHAVAVEDRDGRVGPNLLEGNPEIVLSDPFGTPHGLQVRRVSARAAALHLMFLPGSLRFQDPGGKDPNVRVPGNHIRVPFALGGSQQAMRRLFVRHVTPLALTFDQNDGQLDCTLIVEPGFPILLRDTPVDVVQVNKTAAVFDATIPSLASLPAIFQLSSRSVLIDDERQLSVSEFLDRIGTGTRVGVYGVLEALGDLVHVTAAEILPPLQPGPGNGRKNKIRGVLAEVRNNGNVSDLRVTDVLIGGRDLPSNQPVMAEVWAQKAKIKWVPRFGRHTGHLPPSALEKDMFVEVEWHGATTNLQILAQKINIRSHPRLAFVNSLSGRVDVVDTKSGLVHVVPLGTTPFVFGKESFNSLLVKVTGETVLVHETDGRYQVIDLAGVQKGQEVGILGIRETLNNITALLLETRG